MDKSANTMETVIETAGLTKYYGRRSVVRDLDLKVPRGSILGFLGRNGAGKSTAIRMMLGLTPPTRGTSTILGHDSGQLPPAARSRIGYLAEGHHVYAWMTVGECASFQRACFPQWNQTVFDGVARHFGLQPTTRAGHLSRGQRAGLCLALTLAPEPELLVLDDPALGLDPVARRSLLQAMLYVARRQGRTILFSSHMLSDVERLADHIAVLHHGVLRACCPLETFRANVRQFVLGFDGPPPDLPPLPGLLQSLRTPHELALTFAHYNASVAAILQTMGARQMEEVPLSLEDAFISYLEERGERGFFLDQVQSATRANEEVPTS